MKTYKCPYCANEKEVKDNTRMLICVCGTEMKEVKNYKKIYKELIL